MSTELFTLTLAFRGLSDEDEEEPGIEADPVETLDDDDEELGDADGPAGSSKADDDDDDATLEG